MSAPLVDEKDAERMISLFFSHCVVVPEIHVYCTIITMLCSNGSTDMLKIYRADMHNKNHYKQDIETAFTL